MLHVSLVYIYIVYIKLHWLMMNKHTEKYLIEFCRYNTFSFAITSLSMEDADKITLFASYGISIATEFHSESEMVHTKYNVVSIRKVENFEVEFLSKFFGPRSLSKNKNMNFGCPGLVSGLLNHLDNSENIKSAVTEVTTKHAKTAEIMGKTSSSLVNRKSRDYVTPKI